MKRSSSFVAITTEGGLLPADFLAELLSPKADIDGLTPTSYNLADGERISEQVNRSWNRLKGRWADFKKAMAVKSGHEFTTTETRNRWLQPLFQELGYGQRLTRAKPIEIDGKSYPVSHAWNHVPMHLVGAHIDLDHRTPGVVGAAKASPHSLLQQLLNASDEHLWGIVCNGLNLRLLRDNIALTRQALVEWDLAAIFDGDLYSEFFLLWLVLHQSRFDAERAEQCWIEKWKKKSEDKGLRALDRLRLGVARSIQALGKGLVSHPANKALRLKLSNGELTTQDFYRQILRIIYRLIFLLVAEERELLHLPLPAHDDKDIVDRAVRARQRYYDFYSIGRLRKLTLGRAGTPHSDLWQTFQFVGAKLGSNVGCPELALNALGSFLWNAPRSTPDLNDALISNHQFITAIHALTFVQDGSIRRLVDYKNLGSEELGSVYEGLLELHPRINADTASFELNAVAGNERKMSGSYYTPDSLVQCLLDSALEPVIANAVRGKQRDAAITTLLNLKICDPAAGSGHFLIAAAHRLAKHVARARSDEDEPGPTLIRTALRDVIGRCIYGVDINPMAVELCKVSLWMDAVEPGKPLSFLDHHIQCGNSLLGTTPALLSKGIPDDAFRPIEGDDPEMCMEYRKQNKRERKQETLLGLNGESWDHLRGLSTNITQIANIPDERISDIQVKEQQYAEFVVSAGYEYSRQLADAWCAAFVWKKCPESLSGLGYPITNEVFYRLGRTLHESPKWMVAEIKRLAEQYQFFHWHLAFPEVFEVPNGQQTPLNEICGWSGGFDVVLGNPPWERVKLQEREWFAAHNREDIAHAPNAATRKHLIEQLKTENSRLYSNFAEDVRRADGDSHFLRNSKLYPLCGRGDINLYAVFAEGMRNSLATSGRMGGVVPSGIATDDTTKLFFQNIIERRSLVSLFDFENKGIFPSVHDSYKFCLFTCGSELGTTAAEAEFVFFAHSVDDLKESQRRFVLSVEDIRLLNPFTLTCPVFRFSRDAQLTKSIYRRTTVLGEGATRGGWAVEYLLKLVDPTIHRDLLHSSNEDEEMLPLYEGKQIYHFDHRYATFESEEPTLVSLKDKIDPCFTVRPRYWLTKNDFSSRLVGRPLHYQGFLGVRDITNSTNERTVVTAIRPFVPALNSQGNLFCASAAHALFLCGCLNSFVADYVARQKIGGTHLSPFYLLQLAVISLARAEEYTVWSGPKGLMHWVGSRVLELTYTAWDLKQFAHDCGWNGPPFRWDEERRFLIRCELDAAFFILYGIGRNDSAYILDTFPIVRRKDEERFNGDYRTKRVILEIYDEIAGAISHGLPYNTILDHVPADIRVIKQPAYRLLPLVVPQGLRFPQADQNVYVMRIILSMLNLSANRIEISTLMNACWLVVKPERLKSLARDVGLDTIATWSHSFSDTLDPKLFLPAIDELVRRGELRLVREGQQFIVNRVGTMHIVTDPFIEFDALLALRVESSLTEAERQSILPMASSQEIEVRFKVA